MKLNYRTALECIRYSQTNDEVFTIVGDACIETKRTQPDTMAKHDRTPRVFHISSSSSTVAAAVKSFIEVNVLAAYAWSLSAV